MYFKVNVFLDLEEVCFVDLDVGVKVDPFSQGVWLHDKLKSDIFQNFRD
jgi:hypothetical protein